MNRKQFLQLSSDFKKIRLPALNLDHTEAVNAHSNMALTAYWQHYGFDALHERYQPMYAYGNLSAGPYTIACHHWRPENPRALIVLVHGLFDHVGLYLKLVDSLLSQQFAVFAFDLPGHGLSDGEPTVVNSFDEYSDCLAVVINMLRQHSTLPIYAIGQSTGSAIIANYVLDRRYHEESACLLCGIVLLSPLIYPRKWYLVLASYYLFAWILKRVKRGFSDSSHDKVFCDFIANNDPLQPRFLSVTWVKSMIEWVEKINLLSDTDLPTLIVQGGDDNTVDALKNIPLYQRKFTDSSYLHIEDAGHQLVNELPQVRAEFFSAIHKFISS